MSKPITIQSELGVDYQDAGPWRSYEMYANGVTREELFADAVITEVDQDGSELATYGILDASNEVADAAEKIIDAVLAKAGAS
jgi:hypothetical protein